MADDKTGNDGSVAEVLDDSTAEARRAAVLDEYGDWVAVTTITHGGARAYNVGDPVPKGNVARYGYDRTGHVAKRGSKAVEDALANRRRRR